MIYLRTLGSLDLRASDGREIRSLLAQPKRLALLAYLAVSDADFHRRDSLLALFWPESPEEAARASLRTALSVIRRAVGEEVLVKRGSEEIGIAPGRLGCDVAAFDAALESGELEQALDLYRGDLLTGFHIEGAPEFERWLESERGRLRERAAAAACTLAERAAQDGDAPGAVRWARRAAALAPDDEAALRRLVALLDRSGDRAGALRTYEEFARRLQEELEAEPAPETQALVQVVRDRAEAIAPPPPAGAPAGVEVPLLAPRGGDLMGDPPAAPAAAPVRAGAPLPLAIRLVVAGATAIFLLALTSLALAPAGRPALVPERVLVVPFENRTGDLELEMLGAMAADWITQGLSETGLVEVVTSTTMLATWDYVALETERPHGANLYRALAEETGAGTLVSGSFYRDADSIRYQALVTDVRKGQVLRTMEPVAGPADAPLQAVETLRTRVMGVLATLHDQRLVLTTAGASRPPTFEAYQAYREGTEHFIRGDCAAAIPHHERAAALDSTYAHPRIFAAVCYHNLGQLATADSIAQLLNRSRDRLAPFDRHLLDWVRAWVDGDRLAALEAIRGATDLIPTSEWNYVLGFTARQANRPAEGLAALLRLHPERGYMRGFVFYWQDVGLLRHMLGQHARELKEMQQGRRQYPQDMIALSGEVLALAGLGRVTEVERRIEESLSLPPKSGIDPGMIMRWAASELRAHGRPEAAVQVLQRGIAWYAARPAEEQRSVRSRAGLGEVLYQAGRWEEARTVFAVLAAEQPENIHYLGYLGVLAVRTGDALEAQRIDRALAATDQPYLHGAHTYWRARIAAASGDHEHAMQHLRDSFTQGRAFGLGLHREHEFEFLRDHPAFRELLRPKG